MIRTKYIVSIDHYSPSNCHRRQLLKPQCIFSKLITMFHFYFLLFLWNNIFTRTTYNIHISVSNKISSVSCAIFSALAISVNSHHNSSTEKYHCVYQCNPRNIFHIHFYLFPLCTSIKTQSFPSRIRLCGFQNYFKIASGHQTANETTDIYRLSLSYF